MIFVECKVGESGGRWGMREYRGGPWSIVEDRGGRTGNAFVLASIDPCTFFVNLKVKRFFLKITYDEIVFSSQPLCTKNRQMSLA